MVDQSSEHARQAFANKLRVRICGILVKQGKVLFVKHEPFGEAGHLWSPPGGGINFGESIEQTLKREWKEETGLDVLCSGFLFFHEHIDAHFHALEMHFKVEMQNPDQLPKLGSDPELLPESQLLKDIAFMDFEQISQLNPLTMHRWFLNEHNFKSLLQ